MYCGAAVAVLLFEESPPSTVAWLRLLGAAVVLLAWRRPGRAAWRGRRLALAVAFGMATALMNVAFYEAISRMPLGTAVAIEFCGPVAVAALGSRGRRDVLALLLAAGGVVLIADVQLGGSPLGLACALAAAALWAGYIVLGQRVAGRSAGGGSGASDAIDDLAVGMAVAVVLLCPLGAAAAPDVLSSPRLLLLGVGVGVLSSVVPYVLDQVVLQRVGRARFALLLAVLPATAAIIGLVALAQVPTWAEAAGILAVVAAVLLRSRDTEPPPRSGDDARAAVPP